jgi:CDP-diacylglycerol--serine O-phosphatidyltransferase
MGIIFAFNDHIFPVEIQEMGSAGKNLGVIFGFNNRLYISSFLIFAAAGLDFLDGFIARLLKAQSSLGEQLDSLADVVTFGVLPACIYYQLLTGAYRLEPGALELSMIYLTPSFLIAICSAYRLAKFNSDTRQRDGFLGLATPASALFAAALPLIIFTDAYNLAPLILNKWVLYFMIFFFSILMISEIPMFSFKSRSLGWRGNEWRIIFFLSTIFLVTFFKYTGVALAILLYIILCIVRHLFFKSYEAKNE